MNLFMALRSYLPKSSTTFRRLTVGILSLATMLVFATDKLEAQEDIQISAGGEVVICDGFFYDDGILGAVD